MEDHNLRSRNSKYCFRLQDSVALQTCSAFSANYKLQPSKRAPNRCRGGDPPYKGSNNTSFSLERGFLQLSFLSPQEGRQLQASNRLKFSEQVRGELAFLDGKYILPKDCPS